MALSIITRTYAAYPNSRVIVKDSNGNRARLYANAQGTAVYSTNGEMQLDTAGGITFYVSDDRTYTLVVYDQTQGSVLLNDQLVDPGMGAPVAATPQQTALASQGAITPVIVLRAPIVSGVTLDTTNTGVTQLTVAPSAGTISVYSGATVGSLTLVEAVSVETSWSLQATDVVIQITLGGGAAGTYTLK